MYKALIYSDVHYCDYSSILTKRGPVWSIRLHSLNDSLNWAENLAVENNCDEVLCLGDFFDESIIRSEELSALKQINWAKVPHRMLVGNHEASKADLSFNSVNYFSDDLFDVISSVKVVPVNDFVDMVYIPYQLPNTIKSITEYLPKNDKKKVVLSHNVLAGIQYGMVISQEGFDVDELEKNCLFINGHLHNSDYVRDNVINVGNLTGQNFTEDATKYRHYAWVLTIGDDGCITLDPFENPHALNFYKLDIRTLTDLKKVDTVKQNSVLRINCNHLIYEDLLTKLKSTTNVVDFKIIQEYLGSAMTYEDELELNSNDPIQQFILFAKSRIEPSTILEDELNRLGGIV